MSENWKGSESELFAEFIEHREALMIMRKWWRPGYRISLTCIEGDDKGRNSASVEVTIQKLLAQDVSTWTATGTGATLDEAALNAAAQASFRD